MKGGFSPQPNAPLDDTLSLFIRSRCQERQICATMFYALCERLYKASVITTSVQHCFWVFEAELGYLWELDFVRVCMLQKKWLKPIVFTNKTPSIRVIDIDKFLAIYRNWIARNLAISTSDRGTWKRTEVLRENRIGIGYLPCCLESLFMHYTLTRFGKCHYAYESGVWNCYDMERLHNETGWEGKLR